MKENEATNFDSLLKNIERSKESSKLLVSTNQRIKSLQDRRAETAARIKEDYTINLLDDMWILMGFKDIANEYSCLISEIDQKSRQLEQDYLVTEGQKRAIKKMKTDFVPLPANIPGRTYLQDMLNEEVCKICGRRAEKHSDAWEFMKHRLDEFEASLKDDVENEIVPFYENHYISELRNRNSVLESQLPETTQILRKIKEMMALNNRLHDEVKKIDANIENEFEQKKRILAQADGLSEEQAHGEADAARLQAAGGGRRGRICQLGDPQRRLRVGHPLPYSGAKQFCRSDEQDTREEGAEDMCGIRGDGAFLPQGPYPADGQSCASEPAERQLDARGVCGSIRPQSVEAHRSAHRGQPRGTYAERERHPQPLPHRCVVGAVHMANGQLL